MTINLDTLLPGETLSIIGGEGFYVLDLFRIEGKWTYHRFLFLPPSHFQGHPRDGRILERR